jgi:hypothetical protein
MSRTPVIVCGALAFTLLTTLDVRAVEDLHIPGTACRPVKADVDKVSYNNGSVTNENSALSKIVCPIQYQVNPDGIHPVRLEFKVIDRSTSGNFSCTYTVFNSFDIRPGTGQVLSINSNSSSGNSGSVQTLTINIPNNLPGFVNSATCSIPGTNGSSQSELISYRLFQVPL